MTTTDGIVPLREYPVPEERMFTGRHAILTRILAWIHAEKPGTYLVMGSSGSGKSAVLGRIVGLSDAARRRALLEQAPLEPGDPDPGIGAVDAAVYLRGMGANDLAAALAHRLRLPPPKNCWQLIDAVANMNYLPVLVVDGMEEAIPEQVTKIMNELLVPLSTLTSVLLAARPPEDMPDQPLAELLRKDADASIADLGADPETRQDIERYLARKLRMAGRDDLVPRVAPVLARIAAAKPGGFLYARTVVSQLVRGVIDAQADGWEGQLAATTAAALEHDLARGTLVREGMTLHDAARDLLRPLAWAMGQGMPARVWEVAATALSPHRVQYCAADLEWVLQHYGDYILENRQDGEAAYRLSHPDFVDHLLDCSPHVGGRAPGLLLGEALVALAAEQTAQPPRADATDLCRTYLRHHLPRHATHAGPTVVAALRKLAGADAGSYLPGLARALDDFADHLLSVDDYPAGVIATQHAVETYRALVELNPESYLPSLAAALSSLTAQHAKLNQHEIALAPAREAAEIYQKLTETNPEAYFTHFSTALQNLTDHLAALDRISAAVDVYTGCLESFAASEDRRDELLFERAKFHLNHGDAATGLGELVTLLTGVDSAPSDGVVLAARALLRAHHFRDSVVVSRVWRSITETEPPDWLALTPAQIGLVTEWVTAPSWAESKDFCAAHAGELLDHPATVVLNELSMVERARSELHQKLLDGVRERGIDAAYRPLLRTELLKQWIALTDWQESQAFAEQHAAELFTVEAETELIYLGDPVGTLVHLALLRFARRDGIKTAYACITDRQQMADRLQRALIEVDVDPIAEIAALEGQIFGERFTGAAHLFVAALLMGEPVADFSKLEELAAQADLADRQRLAAEITDLISRAPEQAERLAALPEILLSPAQPGDTSGPSGSP